MPRSRSSEMAQRQSPRGPHALRTSSFDSDPLHHRPITERSPKLGRGAQPDPVNQKKLGTRIADLESQLGQAQTELKNLKDQLSSAEAAKKKAQLELENKTHKPSHQHEEKETVPECPEPVPQIDEVEKQNDPIDETKPLKQKLEEKEQELDSVGKENEMLKNRLSQATSNAALAKAKEDEMSLRLSQQGEELEKSREAAANLKEKLEAAERAKEASEEEIKKMRVQTEQWRKAADAAAAILAGAVDMSGGRIGERCGSMDKNFGAFVGSPGGMGDDLDDGFGSGKRKGSGIRMFGDLWRKRGQK